MLIIGTSYLKISALMLCCDIGEVDLSGYIWDLKYRELVQSASKRLFSSFTMVEFTKIVKLGTISQLTPMPDHFVAHSVLPSLPIFGDMFS